MIAGFLSFIASAIEVLAAIIAPIAQASLAFWRMFADAAGRAIDFVMDLIAPLIDTMRDALGLVGQLTGSSAPARRTARAPRRPDLLASIRGSVQSDLAGRAATSMMTTTNNQSSSRALNMGGVTVNLGGGGNIGTGDGLRLGRDIGRGLSGEVLRGAAREVA
jgi:hypothetical protein